MQWKTAVNELATIGHRWNNKNCSHGIISTLAKLFLLTCVVFTARTQGAPISLSLSYITEGVTGGMAEVPNRITVQAVGTDGVARTAGGDTFQLKIEQQCTISSNICCVTSPTQDNVPGLPIDATMTDNGDGTYSHTYTVTGGGGTVTASVSTQAEGGLYAEYFTNFSLTGSPAYCITEGPIQNYWGTGNVTPLSVGDNVSARWSGQLYPPSTGTYTFSIDHDDILDFTVNGSNLYVTSWGTSTIAVTLNGSTLYDIDMTFQEGSVEAFVALSWITPSGGSSAAVPSTALYSVQRVGGVHEFEVLPTTVPAMSTIEAKPITHIAGDTYTMTVQSRNSLGVAHTVTDDVISVTFNCQSGCGAESFSSSATHTGSGLYQATFVPTIAGTYTVTADLTNAYTATDGTLSTEVSGSPYTVTVYPGVIDPLQCYTDVPVPTIATQVVDVAYDFTIYFVDVYGNVHFQSLADELANGMVVTVAATYDNHDDWPSPIGVLDDPSWITTYGTTISGSAIDSNDGTMAGSMTIQRAGDYTLSISVDGVHVINSPHAYLEVAPAAIYGPFCEPVDVPVILYAGYDYEFEIQGRDLHRNNLQTSLSDEVGTDHSALYSSVDVTSNAAVLAEVTDADYPGVYKVQVSLPKTLEPGYFNVDVNLGGLAVPTPTVDILPCTNTIALDLGLIPGVDETIVFDTLVYTIGESAVETVALPSVPIYCEQEHIQVLLSAEVTLASGSIIELTQTELEGYGIVLERSGTSPKLTVLTEDKTFDQAQFSLVLSATVVEELTWQNTVWVTISYTIPEEAPYEHVVRETEDSPQFDADSVSASSTLQMIEDDSTGEQYLSPVFLICSSSEEWSRTLPAILDEEKGKRFGLTVDLGDADSFLSFDSFERRLTLREPAKGTELAQTTTYIVEIEIRNLSGKVSRYNLQVRYVPCPAATGELATASSYKFIRSLNPPIPYIASIDQYGEVRVRFNETMQPSAALNETELYTFSQQGITGRTLQRNSRKGNTLLDLGEVVGKRSQDFRNFSLIHNGTILINGTIFPSLQISLVPSDPETSCSDSLDFSWQLKNYTKDEMTVQVDFETPGCVSGTSNIADVLKISFFDQRLFAGVSGNLILPETVIQRSIKRQMPPSGAEREALEAMATTAVVVVAATGIISIIFGILLQGALSQLLGLLKNLQIIVHIMLIQVSLVAHAETFLLTLQRILYFEILQTDQLQKDTLAAQDNETIDIHFESVGYETSDTFLNLGPVSLVLVCAPCVILVVYLCGKLCFCWSKAKMWGQRQFRRTMFNRVYIFFDSTFLVLLVSCTINIYQVQRGVIQPSSSFYFSVAFAILVIPCILALAAYLNSNFSQLETARVRDRIGVVYSNLSIKTAGRLIIVFLLLSFSRRIALSFIVTFGRSSFVAQLFFMNFSSVFAISFLGIVRPFTVNSENVIKLANEYTILLLYCHCVTQTEFVVDPRGRWAMGWSLIGLIVLNILLNLGYIMFKNASAFYSKLRLLFIRRQVRQRQRRSQERKTKIDKYRSEILKEVLSAGDQARHKNQHEELSSIIENQENSSQSESSCQSQERICGPQETAMRKILLTNNKGNDVMELIGISQSSPPAEAPAKVAENRNIVLLKTKPFSSGSIFLDKYNQGQDSRVTPGYFSGLKSSPPNNSLRTDKVNQPAIGGHSLFGLRFKNFQNKHQMSKLQETLGPQSSLLQSDAVAGLDFKLFEEDKEMSSRRHFEELNMAPLQSKKLFGSHQAPPIGGAVERIPAAPVSSTGVKLPDESWSASRAFIKQLMNTPINEDEKQEQTSAKYDFYQ